MSPYIRSRGQGEAAVLRAFPAATVLRPAVMFGPGDAFLTPLLLMLRRLPVFPIFGDGGTRVSRFDADELAESFRQSFGSSHEGVPPPVSIEAVKPGATPLD